MIGNWYQNIISENGQIIQDIKVPCFMMKYFDVLLDSAAWRIE